jgi:glycosyltransferase involved in cell wall biosynthesis
MPARRPAPDPSAADGLRVLHVVQKFSSGVGSAIAQYTTSLPTVDHHLLSGTPVDAEGDLAEQSRFVSAHLMSGSHLAKVRRVREVVRELRPDVVHAHSSHGGAYARLALSRRAQRLVYTPHCYAFERRDIPAPVRAAYWAVEALLALNTSAFAACATREWELSAWPTRSAPRYLVPNIAPTARGARRQRGHGPALVAGGGRLSPQKDPEFFVAAVEGLRGTVPDLRAIWLGDGDPGQRRALESAGVEVSGWLPRGRTLDRLAAADLYLHSARWEGFPLMIAEAAALRVPTVVRRLPSFADVPESLTVAERDLAAAVGCLREPAAGRANVLEWARVLRHNTLADQRSALLDLYLGRPALQALPHAGRPAQARPTDRTRAA